MPATTNASLAISVADNGRCATLMTANAARSPFALVRQRGGNLGATALTLASPVLELSIDAKAQFWA